MEVHLLQDIVLILGLSAAVVFLFQRLNLPTIPGYLLAGIIAGPSGLKLVAVSHEVEQLSEIGVILLLFIIGMEFSLKTLKEFRKIVLLGGALQAGGTILAAYGSAFLLGFPWREAVFLGFLVALSSTAIVLKSLQERHELHTPHGKVALSILIFQDIMVAPMILVLPTLAGTEAGSGGEDLLLTFLKAVALIGGVFAAARFVIPSLLFQISKTKSRELFILTIVVLCFTIAWASHAVGLSLALGAFAAGLAISESDYSHQATGVVIPFQEVFASFFFVSIGLLADVSFIGQHLGTIIGLTLAVIMVKMILSGASVKALGFPWRTALLSGFLLFQIGEFSFVLSGSGLQLGLISGETYQYFLSVSILTMTLTPFGIQLSHVLAGKFKHSPASGPFAGAAVSVKDLHDHLVIIGMGVGGKNVAKAARLANIPYLVLEADPGIVRLETANGEPIHFGDGTLPSMLKLVGVPTARVVVITISDPKGVQSMVSSIRSISSSVHIITRVKYVQEGAETLRRGANEAIPEEFESSIAIFSRVLHRYLVPENQIQTYADEVRANNYEMLGSRKHQVLSPLPYMDIPQLNISCVKAGPRKNEIIGKTLREADIRNKFGVNLLAVERDGQYLGDIHPDVRLLPNDLLFLAGTIADINRFQQKIEL
ncbi:MAG: cation:proton antiporter [Haliscomenobacter sp.]|nr:cation:proton antiporter [Haliscomenobacter sp.]